MKTIVKYNSNISRSTFIKQLSFLGLGASLLKFPSCTSNDKTIKFYGTGTLDIGNSWVNVKNDIGINVSFSDNGNDTGPIIANMINGNAAYDFDIGGFQGGTEAELANAAKIVPWDLSKIPNWKNTWDWIKNIDSCRVNGKQYGLPLVVNADSIIYLPEKIGGEVDSYEVIFDPKFKGKTAMEDAWINSAIFAAIYLKENNIVKIKNPADLEESELGQVMEFLIKHKKDGQFRTFWRGWEDGVRLIKSGEVYAMTGWEPIVYEAQKAGVNAKYAVPREGYEGWSNNLVICVGAEKRKILEEVHQFANWELAGFYGCKLAKDRGYIVPNENTIQFASNSNQFDADKQKALQQHVKNKFMANKGKVYWQNTRPKNYKLYEQWWSKLRSV